MIPVLWATWGPIVIALAVPDEAKGDDDVAWDEGERENCYQLRHRVVAMVEPVGMGV